jgi:DNA-binding transcriptional MerR regulator/methylmalonyl-CoA mutase cobalamin-binding subunit
MPSAQYPIRAVVRQTGLSAHVIRIWEKRYGAVHPERTATNRRLYSAEQVERLSLLRDITRSGLSIGYVAKLPTETLRERTLAFSSGERRKALSLAQDTNPPSFLDECLAALKALDAASLEDALKRSEMAYGALGMLLRVAAPLAKALGDQWRAGSVNAAHEHFATAILRTYLANAARPFGGVPHGPDLIIATPAGQMHELGALLVSAVAANVGWHVTYLGANLPAPEIAGAARQNGSRAVALSIVYPEDDKLLPAELERLRELLPPEVVLMAGGRAAPAYSQTLDKIGALQSQDLGHFSTLLDFIRTPAPSKATAAPATAT